MTYLVQSARRTIRSLAFDLLPVLLFILPAIVPAAVILVERFLFGGSLTAQGKR